ncbi:4a-hydroxytetrahydrobiopterin dehydratase [Aeromicrobium sp. Root495]|uniref:4a-hydroxytetrahydrobiopterin dehydratase n=1 Tax=Aeromicrobium sp. Root495 TaxID=1736550 RepID=UPI0006F46673|nr:4a-hydroxytetrahydrobiopterin dehydratase [Aeromicrobium sp. Root495]KQY59265.1 4a-hydroxytetrahydrobiopterin dehydratase [Aeromicrobium sp. Root495]RYJ07447.1 MAG: 4a-hydroxytetrahydrobiopterin dehydratase [Actinomycetales bacterium]
MGRLTVQQILDADLADWTRLAVALHARFDTGDFATGTDFVTAISEAAEDADHHPDLTLTYGAVDVQLHSHDVGGVTDRDVDLARQISDIAVELGIESVPGAPTLVEIGLDTARPELLGPFWSAVLTGSVDAWNGDEEVKDPTGQTPLIWMQDTTPHTEPRQRFHLDVWIPPEELEARTEAVLAAGGTLFDDSESPSFVVLADPDGNKACLCTLLDR